MASQRGRKSPPSTRSSAAEKVGAQPVQRQPECWGRHSSTSRRDSTGRADALRHYGSECPRQGRHHERIAANPRGFAQAGASSIYDDVVYEGQSIEMERLWLWVARNSQPRRSARHSRSTRRAHRAPPRPGRRKHQPELRSQRAAPTPGRSPARCRKRRSTPM
jgi:hypothetical protein